jgi:anti-anti-sigma regulatory factor
MIIEARGDVVTLRGILSRNEWQNVKAAANHLLHHYHAPGIIIDCKHIDRATEEGIDTFIDARRDIEAQGARIMLCHVPPEVLQAMRSVPGARSQLPVADTIEDARASFRLMHGTAPKASAGVASILVPLFGDGDAEIGVDLACRIAPRDSARIHMLYVVTVPRALPIGTPLGENAAIAERELARGEAIARKRHVATTRQIEQTRSIGDAIMQTAQRLGVAMIVVGLRELPVSDERGQEELVMDLLHRPPCQVVISRAAGRGEPG